MPLTPIAIATYQALVSQTGTDNPQATVLKNTISTSNPTWARTGEGTYTITLTGAFTTNKTVVTLGETAGVNYIAANNNIDTITLSTYTDAGVPTDDFLNLTPIKIEIYT